MSLQMHTLSSSAPFFKQQVPTQNSTFFLSQHQRQQQNTSQNVRKQKEVSSEIEQQSGDRLSALHTRLQLEAEKIRKWKNATEAEIKEKDKKLKEATLTIENQRKSVTELQLKKESLSSRLRDEVSNQKEIQRKICSTRDMCTALKNHAVRLDDAICKGEQDRDILTQLHTEKMKKFQELLARFQELESGQRGWMDSQTQMLAEEKNVSTQLRARCQSLEQQLNTATEEVSLLKELNKEKVELTQSLEKELDEKSGLLAGLSHEKASLLADVSAKDSDISGLRAELDSLQRQLAGTQDMLKKKEEQMSNLQAMIEQTKVSHAEQIDVMQSSLTSCQLKCQQLEGLNSELELSLKETTSQLSGDIESLSTQLEHTKQELTQAQEESSSLKQSLLSEKELTSGLKAERLNLKDQLADALIDSEKLAQKMQDELKQKNNAISNLEGQLEKQGNDHQASLAEWTSVQSKLEAQMSELEREKAELNKKVESLDQELSTARAQFTEINTQCKMSIEMDARVIDGLKNEKKTACEEIKSLKEQVETLSNEKSELVKECATMKQLKCENAKLSKSVQSNQAQVEKLQKELEVVQSDLGSKNGELSGLMDKYKRDAEAAQEECTHIKQSLETQVTELQAKLESTRGELGAQVEKYKTEAQNAREEHELAASSYKEQSSELYSVLTKYREDHQIVLSQKDREIESLREQIKNSEKEMRASETELSSCKDKVELLQSDLSAKTQEMEDLLKAVECLQSKAKVSATPRKPTQLSDGFVTPVHSTIHPGDESVVSSTPKSRSNTLKKVASTPRGQSRPPTDTGVRSTLHRMYNHRVTSTPLAKSSSHLLRTSAHEAGNKAKRMRSYQDDIEADERSKFDELYPDQQLEEESVFKKPKTKGVAVRKASSTTTKYSLSNTKYSTRTPMASRNGRPRKSASEGKKKTEDLSWFDSDSVFGLGVDD